MVVVQAVVDKTRIKFNGLLEFLGDSATVTSSDLLGDLKSFCVVSCTS
jgi:hypothetical protein